MKKPRDRLVFAALSACVGFAVFSALLSAVFNLLKVSINPLLLLVFSAIFGTFAGCAYFIKKFSVKTLNPFFITLGAVIGYELGFFIEIMAFRPFLSSNLINVYLSGLLILLTGFSGAVLAGVFQVIKAKKDFNHARTSRS